MELKPIKQETDLGLGSKVIQENQNRFVNRDGTLNVYRKGVLERGSFSPYHAILGMSWGSFYSALFGIFIIINVIFAIFYYIVSPTAFPELAHLSPGQKYLELFFYSFQIITTLGASPMHPISNLGNTILSLEVIVGLWCVALSTGLIFARFSNPAVKIIYSDYAVIAPYNNNTGFMFRIINGRNNELIQVTATVTLAMLDKEGKRQFLKLPLEREMVIVFPLNWTVVHPIDPTSPIYGMTAQDLADMQAEFLIYITAVDKDLSKTVYSRFSYLSNEIIVGAKFVSMMEKAPDGTLLVDPRRIHLTEKV